jgi:hypothetical protein
MPKSGPSTPPASPAGAKERSPGREPWVSEASLTPVPSFAGAGEGCRRRGEGRPSQGSRPGLQYSAPDGAGKRIRRLADFMNESTLHDTSYSHMAFVCKPRTSEDVSGTPNQ